MHSFYQGPTVNQSNSANCDALLSQNENIFIELWFYRYVS